MSVWHLYTKRQTGWTWGGDARGGRKTEMVDVFEIPAERWAKAAERAMPLSVMTATKQVDARGVERYTVAVASSRGDRYYCVVITVDGDGAHAECDCPAGERDVLCKHVAKALAYTGNWGLAVPEAAPAPRPRPVVRTRTFVLPDGTRVTRAILPGDDPDDDLL